MKKINCGGFYIDEESLELEDNVLSVKNGGSSLLPTVTEEDNGNILAVVDGAWAKATPSGGGGLYWVHFWYDDDTNLPTVDKTYAEIESAFESGLLPILYSDNSLTFSYLEYLEVGKNHVDFRSLTYIYSDTKEIVVNLTKIYSNGTVEALEERLSLNN